MPETPHRRSATRLTLARDLRGLGLATGDRVFVHSSFNSLGPVDGGAEAVIGALEDAVGPDGLVAMPSFNLVQRERRHETWDVATTPSTVGWLTEVFRALPDTWRSDHYSHAVAARGSGARELVADHLRLEGLSSPWDRVPWGKTYGEHSPMVRLHGRGGKLLMLGVDYDSSTYVHFVEVLEWHRRLEHDPEAPYPGQDRERLGAFWDRTGQLSRGRVAQAACRLFGIAEYVDALWAEVRRQLQADPS